MIGDSLIGSGIQYDWDREKAKEKYDTYVINGGMSSEDFFKKIQENGLKVEGLDEAKKIVAADNYNQQQIEEPIENKKKERFIQQLPAEFEGSLIDNIYQSAQKYGGFGKTLVRGAADMFGGFLSGAEKVGEGINDIQNKGNKVNIDILKNDFVEGKFKEIYGRLPTKDDAKAIDDLYSVVDNDKDYQDFVSSRQAAQQEIDDKSFGESAFDITAGLTTTAFDALEAPAMYAIHTLQNTQIGAPVLNGIGKVFEFGGRLADKLPGLKQWKESLPEEKQKEFDSWVGMMTTLGLAKGISRGRTSGNIKTDATGILEDIGAEGIIDMYKKGWKPEYSEKQISKTDKILQPGKRDIQLGEADAAAKGLLDAASENKISSYGDIKDIAEFKKTDSYKALQDGLNKADETYIKTAGEEVYQASLDGLLEAFGEEKGLAPKLKADRDTIIELLKKNEAEGLSLTEKQMVKQLHTEYNNLFTAAGKESAGFNPKNLRALRNIMKEDIEAGALENGYSDVIENNTTYNNNRALAKMIENQENKARVEESKIKDLNLVEKTAQLITDLPLISQLVSRPIGIILESFKGRTPKDSALTVSTKVKKLVNKMKADKSNAEQVAAVKKIFGNKEVLDSIEKIVKDKKNSKATADVILEMIRNDIRNNSIKKLIDTTTKETKQPLEPQKQQSELPLSETLDSKPLPKANNNVDMDIKEKSEIDNFLEGDVIQDGIENFSEGQVLAGKQNYLLNQYPQHKSYIIRRIAEYAKDNNIKEKIEANKGPYLEENLAKRKKFRDNAKGNNNSDKLLDLTPTYDDFLEGNTLKSYQELGANLSSKDISLYYEKFFNRLQKAIKNKNGRIDLEGMDKRIDKIVNQDLITKAEGKKYKTMIEIVIDNEGTNIKPETVNKKVSEEKTTTKTPIDKKPTEAEDIADSDYKMEHKAPIQEEGNLSIQNVEDLFPDIYTAPTAYNYYKHMGKKMDLETISMLKEIKNNPNRTITIYRAVPKSAKARINKGDWVTINKNYAIDHGKTQLNDYKIIEIKAKPSEVFSDGNSIHEFGYDPITKK